MLRLGALARGPLEERPAFVLERADPLAQAGAIAVLAVFVPSLEQACGDGEAGLAELLLGGEPLAVGGEVADEVGPAELAALGVEVVGGPSAVGAGDALEVVSGERLGLALVPVGGDPEDGRPLAQRAPERALAAAQAPAGLVEVDGRGGADLVVQCGVGWASASPARSMIASIEPLESSRANSSSISSTLSRRETRLRTASVATAACKPGPKAERGTPAGSSARVWAAQAGQRSRCRRCSVTVTAIGGSSQTWRRCTAAASTRSSAEKPCAQA